MVDLDTLTTVEEADAALEEAIDNNVPNDEYWALVEHRDRLFDRTRKPAPDPDKPGGKPGKSLAEVTKAIAEIDQALAEVADPNGKAELLVQRRVFEFKAADLSLAEEFSEMTDEALALAIEEAGVEVEEQRSKDFPEGSARRARAERLEKEARARSERLSQEQTRRSQALKRARVDEQWVASQTDRVAQSLYDQALAAINRNPNLQQWEKDRALVARKAALNTPLDAGFVEKIRDAVTKEIEARREQELYTFAAEGRSLFNVPQLGSGFPGDPARSGTTAAVVEAKLKGDVQDPDEHSIVSQLAHLLLRPEAQSA